jgi:hypothetical protein
VALRVPMADPVEKGDHPRAAADLTFRIIQRSPLVPAVASVCPRTRFRETLVRAYLVSGFLSPAAFCAA